MRKPSGKLKGMRTMDGAGVRLVRVLGNAAPEDYDPFLLLDHFGSDKPEEYLAGFPWHPHRGMETVTYLLRGEVEHEDSLGNKGVIGPGDAQWMTAGSGIIHQEMPREGRAGPGVDGFQLWVNLPARLKMTEPRYRSITAAEIPRSAEKGGEVLVLAGEYKGLRGATPDLFLPILYLVVHLRPEGRFSMELPDSRNAAAYLFEGGADFSGVAAASGELLHFPPRLGGGGAADWIEAAAGPGGASFLFLAGEPLREPIAWGGPIVMNTRAELEQAFSEYRKGRFVKVKATGA